jgi:hypothetical protein
VRDNYHQMKKKTFNQPIPERKDGNQTFLLLNNSITFKNLRLANEKISDHISEYYKEFYKDQIEDLQKTPEQNNVNICSSGRGNLSTGKKSQTEKLKPPEHKYFFKDLDSSMVTDLDSSTTNATDKK